MSRDHVIILTHGFTGTVHEVKPLANYLNEQGYNAEAHSLLGHGTHPRDLFGIKKEDWCKYFENVVKKHQDSNKKVILGGLSFGATLAFYLNAKGLYLDGILAMSPVISAQRYKISMFKAIKPLVPYLNFELPTKIFKKITRQKPTEEEKKLPMDSYHALPTESIIEFLSCVRETSKILHDVTAPVLILHAKDDPYVKYKESLKIFMQLSTCRKELILLDKGGHVLPIADNKEEIFQYIVKFIDDVLKNTK